MSKKDEALKLALKAIASAHTSADMYTREHIITNFINPARAALAEQSAEIPQSITCPFCESQHVPGWLHDYNMDRGAYGKQPAQPAQVDPCIDGSCSCCWTHLDEQPAPPPECQTDAEKTAFAFGWWKALEENRKQPAQDREPCGWRMKHNGGWAYSFTADAWDFIYAVSPAARKAARDNAPASKPFDTHAAPGQSFDTHSRTLQPSKPLPEDYTALEQALTRLQKRYADLEGKVGKPLTDEQINLFINGRGEEGDDDYIEPTGDGFGLTDADLVRLVRRVEVAHGITGEQK